MKSPLAASIAKPFPSIERRASANFDARRTKAQQTDVQADKPNEFVRIFNSTAQKPQPRSAIRAGNGQPFASLAARSSGEGKNSMTSVCV